MSKMGTSAIKVILLFVCFDQMGVALVIPGSKIVSVQTSEEFNVHITEKGTKFVEKIQIDGKNGLEYFYVPAHNGRVEADYLYDFKQNMSVRRDRHESECYLSSLPDKLPKPDELKTGLQRASKIHSSGKPLIVWKYWGILEQVNKTLLSQEVLDFCGQFPVYRTREVHLNSAQKITNKNAGGARSARDLRNLPPLCKRDIKFPHCYKYPNGKPHHCCNADNWTYDIKIRPVHCVYWVEGCKLDRGEYKIKCSQWNHNFSAMICYKPKCT